MNQLKEEDVPVNRFELTWENGEVEVLCGVSVTDAVLKAGYDKGALLSIKKVKNLSIV